MTTAPAVRPQDTSPGEPRQQTGAITLNRWQKILIGTVAVGALAIAAIGFAGSYTSVTELAEAKGFGWFARIFTIGIDAGILVLLALDLLLTWIRIPFPLLRHIAWFLTGATVVFNAAAAWPDYLGSAMHAVIPVLFIAIIEAARHAIGRIANITADAHYETPPLSRWLLALPSTFALYRWMRICGIRSYEQALRMQRDIDLYIADLRRKHGRRHWRRNATADELLVLRFARKGIPLADALEMPDRRRAARAAAEHAARMEAERAAQARQLEAEAVEAERKLKREQAEAEARRLRAETAAAEAEAKRRTEAAEVEAEAKRRAALAEAAAVEEEAKRRAEVAAAKAKLELEAKQRAEADAERLRRAEVEAKLAALARRQRQADEEEQARRRAHQAAEKAKRIAATRTTSTSASGSAATPASVSASATVSEPTVTASVPNPTSASASGTASIGGRRGRRQAEIEAVLVRIVQAGNPEAVSLEDVMTQFDLKQTTAWDRLSTARDLWKKHNAA
ncbi:DUF2637 domain-containing protein [Streptomyces macrosporus]|uniref:DUF2637 domain-containing protein n=1 Tax=Streptomyces macrosporus TaxID=44032 RepID=A0ABN3KKB2_9ACTN